MQKLQQTQLNYENLKEIDTERIELPESVKEETEKPKTTTKKSSATKSTSSKKGSSSTKEIKVKAKDADGNEIIKVVKIVSNKRKSAPKTTKPKTESAPKPQETATKTPSTEETMSSEN